MRLKHDFGLKNMVAQGKDIQIAFIQRSVIDQSISGASALVVKMRKSRWGTG